MELRVLASVLYLTSRKYADASEVILITPNKDTRFVFAEATAVAVLQLFITLALASILCR